MVIGWASIQSLWKKFTVVHDENLFHSFNGRERKRWTVSTQSTYTKPKNFLTTYGDDLQLTLSVYALFKWCKLFHSLQYISKKHVSIFSDFFCRAVSFYLTEIDSRKYATVRKLLYSTSKSETIWIFYKYFFSEGYSILLQRICAYVVKNTSITKPFVSIIRLRFLDIP